MGQFTHLPYARTSHLRTLSKILGSGLSTCCRGAPTFVEASRPVYRGFFFRQHLLVSIPAFPRCSGPEAFPSGEPHILARFRRTSTPCEALFRPPPPGPAGLRRPLLGGARIVHAPPGFGKAARDREGGVWGKSVSLRIDTSGRRNIKKKKT